MRSEVWRLGQGRGQGRHRGRGENCAAARSWGAQHPLSVFVAPYSCYEPHKKEQKFKPGPGNYSPDTSPVKKKESAWKIGTEVRRDLKVEK